MTSRRATETTSDAVENDTSESIVLKNPYIVPESVSLAPLEVILTQKWAKISKVWQFDLEI